VSADQDASLVVGVGQGKLKGALERNGVRVWRSIPYAAAPVGARRFTAPEPPSTWEGVRDATRFGPICPQPPLAGTAPAEPMDEDCLFLNVWSPHDAHGLPVMVWIHGGAYFVGSGSAPNYSGSHLAAKGPAVVVTLNYRLGYRGYLDLSMLPGAEGRFDTNLGIRDQIAALSWLRDNIDAFGGNPNNVTIFGQSAGGGGVCCLLASPLATGLFHAAIAQSPPADSVFSRDDAATVTTTFLAMAGKPDAGFDDILEFDPSTLLNASGRLVETIADIFPGQHACQPVIDGDVLPERPTASIAAARGSLVPLLIGSNEDEGSLFARPPMPALIPVMKPNSDIFLRQNYPGAEDAIAAAYYGHGRFGTEISIGGDGMVTMPALHIAESLCPRAPVFVYRFRWTNEALMNSRLGTPHALDVPFVFGNFQVGGLVNLQGEDATEILHLSQTMQTAWLGFARDHVPDVTPLIWPAYDRRDREVMIIDRDLAVARDPDAAQRRSWGQIAASVIPG
jgi:para-nitrobenzyl esterase